eukprot:CAMPEP_0202859358 /NCGR_PEP_ID=MMETSP1391-20130828/1508_1 /ASSEMBLY_ACC=CAM_ASM_000867 /TAXON_ID=1034604 /ORGANISM="Chlamydomonas leiostraca, Strain SAG 11-49" /LENGTH=169 /DNA_ID=CAMNT_0049538385 /DNA_START=73 /DNA_END=582 /DNA_ORIENTATION=+
MSRPEAGSMGDEHAHLVAVSNPANPDVARWQAAKEYAQLHRERTGEEVDPEAVFMQGAAHAHNAAIASAHAVPHSHAAHGLKHESPAQGSPNDEAAGHLLAAAHTDALTGGTLSTVRPTSPAAAERALAEHQAHMRVHHEVARHDSRLKVSSLPGSPAMPASPAREHKD